MGFYRLFRKEANLFLFSLLLFFYSCNREIEIKSPDVIKTDLFGNFYLLEKEAKRLLKFNKNGEIVYILDKLGKERGKFFHPFCLAVGEDSYYICNDVYTRSGELEREEIVKFDLKGNYLGQVFVFYPDKSSLKSLDYLYPIMGVAARGKYLYILMIKEKREKSLLKTDSSGKIIFSKPVDISNSGEIFVAENGFIYIPDTGKNLILMLDMEGNVVKRIGGGGIQPGRFRYPRSIAVKDDFIYVCDEGNRRIQKLSLEGKFVLEFEKPPLLTIKDVAFESIEVSGGEIAVADLIGKRIIFYDTEGRVKRKLYSLKNNRLSPHLITEFLWGVLALSGTIVSIFLILKIFRIFQTRITIRIFIIFSILEAFTISITGFIIYLVGYDLYEKEVREKLLSVVKVVSREIKGEEIKRVEKSDEVEYQKILEKIKEVANLPELQPIDWVGVYKIENGYFYYGVDIEENGVYTPFFKVSDTHRTVLVDGIPRVFMYSDETGNYFSAVAPVKDSEGRIVSLLEISKNLEFLREYRKQILFKIFTIMGISILITGIISLLLSIGITKPVRILMEGTKALGEGRYDTRLKSNYKHEMGKLIDTFNDMLKSISEKEKIRGIMNKVVSREIAEELLRGKIDLGGEEKRVSVLFADIRKFTTISEKLHPRELIQMLNEYFSTITPIIDREGGVIDKYIGDAIMAIFGAPIEFPDDARRAVKSAVGMLQELEKLNKKRISRNLEPIRIGIGINSGIVVAGNMGSPDRLNYTVVGDPVNVASRIESLTKIYGVNILVSEETFNQIKDEFLCRELDKVRVKGKTEAIKIYEVFPSSEIDDNTYEITKLFSEGLLYYRSRKWENAIVIFQKILDIKPDDSPSRLFIQRIENFKSKPPPEDWDGVYQP
jgi:class 3 adenylate cyclase